MASTDLYENVWKRIKDIRFAMLTTIEGDGSLVARPMTTVQKTFSGSLWFFTSRRSPPAIAVAENATVGVQYTDNGDDVYVSLSGDARLDDDHARKEAMWSPMVKAWFPQGVDDPDLVLLRVDVHTAEYWDVKESKPVQLFKMARAAITGHPPTDLGEHRTIAL
ncbi:MAG: pyridoxamine 5'-phosphate oxidase family protein [Burkholderiaceae bacterium]